MAAQRIVRARRARRLEIDSHKGIWERGLGETLITAPEMKPPTLFRPFRPNLLEHHAAASLAPLLGTFWDRALKATSVRNPWDIMVSAWQWRREGKGSSPPVTAGFEE